MLGWACAMAEYAALLVVVVIAAYVWDLSVDG